MADARFLPETSIKRNQAWTSGNGRIALRLQEDGNFVLYRDDKSIWQADNVYPRGFKAEFAMDGNLYVYDDQGGLVWQAIDPKSEKYPNYRGTLAVQEDGNVVIYDPRGVGEPKFAIWATNTGS
ncbi:hypothetical protein ACFWZ2_13180 [Streptomyces sp. NPDC059002]|uniref:hypothetical protein n=1 Tax=Streptomyces sp. NPDC059002 TaxID=3346690 RepID=UPI00369549ED